MKEEETKPNSQPREERKKKVKGQKLQLSNVCGSSMCV